MTVIEQILEGINKGRAMYDKVHGSLTTAAENGYRYQNFLTGLSGDYLAVSENNTKDLYAISSDVFDTIYQKVE